MLTVIDNGTDNALSFDPTAPDARSIMLSSAAALVATTLDMEGKLADTAKAWGANVFTLAYPADDAKPVTMDALIGDSKVAASWATLTTTDAGRKAKGRMEVYFSNARLVAETFETLSDDDKRDIRAGLVSIHYRAGLIRKAAADAKKAAKQEAARVEAEAAANAPAPAADVVTPVAPSQHSVGTVIAALSERMAVASDDELTAVYDDFAALIAAFDARINAATDAATVAA